MVSLFPHPASFRFRLTTDTLAFGYILPATGRIRVSHPLVTCAAGRTYDKAGAPELSSGAPASIRVFILMRNFNASKALSNFDSAQGAGAQA